MTNSPLNLARIQAAWSRISGSIHRTPLLSSRTLGRELDRDAWLKCENLQKTGSFKPRGALNRILYLEPEEKRRGVVTISAGNHAQALAWAAADAGASCTVVMPESAPRSKVEASRGYGATVILHGNVFEAFERALELAEKRSLTFVHPFDDEAVMAGQGTVALEILEDLPEAGTLVVPVGGGGLLAGMAVAAHSLDPGIRIFGVEPTGADSMRRSLRTGEPVHLEEVDTAADGLASPMAGEETFPLIRERVEDVVSLSDEEITEGMSFLLSRAKILAEPAGAASVGALLAQRIPVGGDGPVVAVVSGGNVDLPRLPDLLRLSSPTKWG